MSLARGALTFARLNRLFALCGAYGAKRVDMATVDNDGTVIVRRALWLHTMTAPHARTTCV